MTERVGHMQAVWKKALLSLSFAALVSCTASPPPSPYLPHSGAVPGETITVKPNENVYSIAQDHGVSMREIMVLNNLQSPYVKPGQSLVLPFKRGDVASAPTSEVTSTSMSAPPSMAPIPPSSTAVESETLPPPTSASPVAKPIWTPTTPSASQGQVDVLNAPSSPPPKPVATTLPAVPPPPAPPPAPPLTTNTNMSVASAASGAAASSAVSSSAPDMIWPVQGPVLSAFGAKGQGINNDGVNIGAPKGSPVVASAPGTVVYSGDEMKGFGKLILIRHEGGWVTAYAYLDRVLVGKDAVVAQGDEIGTVGKSGSISSPQLHFEVRQGGKPVDPNGIVKGN